MAEFRKAGITLVKKHPKYSPGLNGIEKAWKFLRDTIDATEPAGREFRASLCALAASSGLGQPAPPADVAQARPEPAPARAGRVGT